jgi:hypothetical protein
MFNKPAVNTAAPAKPFIIGPPGVLAIADDTAL